MEGFDGESAGWNAMPPTQPVQTVLTASASFKGEGKAASAQRRRASTKPNLEAEEFINLLHGSDPVKVELNRLENEVRGENSGILITFFPVYLKLLSRIFLVFKYLVR